MNRSQDWLDQAERDLCRARIDMQYAYWEWACFTAQQAAEKAVKALLMSRGHTVWGHAITPMLRLLEGLEVPVKLIEGAQLLDAHYILARYPNGFTEGKPADYYNEQKAQEAVRAADEIICFCKAHLHRSG